MLLSRDGIVLTGDITPSYCALGAGRFASIRDAFAVRGVAVKVLFLMRDPVERIWSAIRMKLQGGSATANPEDPMPDGEDARVLALVDKDFVRMRTDYRGTIAALKQASAPDALQLEFHERLFDEPCLRDLCNFLGIDFVTPETERRLNASPKLGELSVTAIRKIAHDYGDVYRFAEARFGMELIDRLWPNARHSRG